ncbi:MAG: hypothetical protein GX301_13655 [Gracilibacteraceae bacterium]|nr:hypothetical protein [Gracilibacteraceae bacterium]
MKRSGMSWSATAECAGGACKGGEKNTTRAVGIYWRSLAEGEGVEIFEATCLALASMFFMPK